MSGSVLKKASVGETRVIVDVLGLNKVLKDRFLGKKNLFWYFGLQSLNSLLWKQKCCVVLTQL